MKKTLAVLFVLLSLLSFVALNYGSFGTLQFLMLGAFVVLAALILALGNKNIDSLFIVFFSLGLLDSVIILTKTWLSFELAFYALVNMVGLMLPLTGTDRHVRQKSMPDIKPVEMPEPKPKQDKKFAASKTGKVYHKADCDWVDNIKDKNRVWFETAAQAKKAGYKAHKCKLNGK